MADEDKPGTGKKASLLTLIQQWQVIVTFVAAAVALWYGFEDRRRTELGINRTAVDLARNTDTRDRFFADPYNTLVEFQATFPDHAYCTALGTFLAEIGRESAAEERTVPAPKLNAAVDAVAGRLDVLLLAAGTSQDAVDGAAASFAGTPDTPERCEFAGVELSRTSLFSVDRDCRQLIQTYTQSECLTRRMQIVAAAGPADQQPPPSEEARPPNSGFRIRQAFAPPDTCGWPLPTLYLQIIDENDRGAATGLQRDLQAAGWNTPGVELVEGGQTSGDVRYYFSEQKECAEWLAQELGRHSGSDTPFATISLEGRYRKLPEGQMEVWLPADL